MMMNLILAVAVAFRNLRTMSEVLVGRRVLKNTALACVLLLAVSELIGLAAMAAIRIGDRGSCGW